MVNNLRDLLSLHEGRRPRRYRDSLGFWTIGVGHLIDERKGGSIPVFIVTELIKRNIDVYADEPMPEDLIDRLLDYDIRKHIDLLDKTMPWAKNIDPVRYVVLIDMCFNLGTEPFDGDGVKDWPVFVNQVKTGQYAAAAKNMRGTTWAKQVHGRAERLATMMESGQWPA